MAMKLPIIDEKPCTPSKMPKVLSCFSGGAESLTAFRAAGQNAKPPVKQKPDQTMSCTVYTFANITLSMHKGRLANTDQKTIFFAENLSASQPPGRPRNTPTIAPKEFRNASSVFEHSRAASMAS